MNKQQLSFGFPIRSDKNRDEQPQKIHVAGSLKFRIKGVEVLFYLFAYKADLRFLVEHQTDKTICLITQTCPCNILHYFTAVRIVMSR